VAPVTDRIFGSRTSILGGLKRPITDSLKLRTSIITALGSSIALWYCSGDRCVPIYVCVCVCFR
jgi:hypothetical protein